MSTDPPGVARIVPKLTPFAVRGPKTSSPASCAAAIAFARVSCSSVVISRASISMKPAPNMPSVLRSLATFSRKCVSLLSPALVGSKLTNGKRWPSTNTFATLSPPPPERGMLWQPEHEFESGPEMRLKFSGFERGARGLPVPVVSGRPAPSSVLKLASKSTLPSAKSVSAEYAPASTSSWSTCASTAGSSPITPDAGPRISFDVASSGSTWSVFKNSTTSA